MLTTLSWRGEKSDGRAQRTWKRARGHGTASLAARLANAISRIVAAQSGRYRCCHPRGHLSRPAAQESGHVMRLRPLWHDCSQCNAICLHVRPHAEAEGVASAAASPWVYHSVHRAIPYTLANDWNPIFCQCDSTASKFHFERGSWDQGSRRLASKARCTLKAGQEVQRSVVAAKVVQERVATMLEAPLTKSQ